MKVDGNHTRNIWVEPDGWSVGVIDQTQVPHRFATVRLASLADAARAMIAAGLRAEEVDEDVFAVYLYAPDMLDPDLVIRTSGELRMSNFLLWQLAYSEFFFVDTLWPDFGEDELRQAVAAYAGRQRRFGGR